jgi:hypothetical protein
MRVAFIIAAVAIATLVGCATMPSTPFITIPLQ